MEKGIKREPIKVNLEVGKKYNYGNSLIASGTFLGLTDDERKKYCFSPEDSYTYFTSLQKVGGKVQKVVMFDVEPDTREIISKEGMTVTRSDMQELYKIACPKWKGLITHLTLEHLGTFEEEGTIPQKDIDEMFEAATMEQLPTLIEIFGERDEEKLNEYRVFLSREVVQRGVVLVKAANKKEAREKIEQMLEEGEISEEDFVDEDEALSPEIEDIEEL